MVEKLDVATGVMLMIVCVCVCACACVCGCNGRNMDYGLVWNTVHKDPVYTTSIVLTIIGEVCVDVDHRDAAC